MFQEQQQPSAATGMGSLLRGRNPLSPKSPRTRPNSSDLEGSEKSPSAKSASSFRLPRSRIGTETSVETALENVPGAAAGSVSSFEEELFRQDSRNLLHYLGS